MPTEFIWTISADGVPCRISALQDPKCLSETEWRRIPISDGSTVSTIVSSENSAFAIDHSGRVLILVLPTHVAIRERVEMFNNQRWLGVWRGTFFIDRPRFSDKTGRFSKDPSFDQIDSGWSWEDQWIPHLDPRKYDSDGWQYSLSFLAPSWDKKCRMFHMVRRRMLKRHMRYTSHDQWVELSCDDSTMFTELAIGGGDVMGDGETLLFGLGTDGNIYRRDGIQTNRPSGTRWEYIPKISVQNHEVDDVTLLSASPSLATLLAITWDGKMFHRKGMTRQNPNGVSWQSISTPKNKAVISVAIGTETLWCITADGTLYFTRLEIDKQRKEHILEKITAETYSVVTQGGVSKISVTKKDQVFCLSTRGNIEIRMGIEKSEPSGKRFEKLIDRCDVADQRYISIHAGSVTFSKVPEYFLSTSSLQSKMEVLQFKKSDWRLAILERLQEASERSWSAMNSIKGMDLETSEENDKYENVHVKRIRCQIKQGKEAFKSVNVTITDSSLDISGEQIVQKTIEVRDLKSVLPSFQRLPQKYLLHVVLGADSEVLYFAFTDEKSRENFQATLENMIRESICSSTRNAFGQSLWTISTKGVVRWHCLAEMSQESQFEKRVNPGVSRGLVVPGIFSCIDCGVKRSVWAINENGCLYSLSSHYDPLNGHGSGEDYKMTAERNFEMLEYQKHAIFRGFISFQGTQKGIAGWMCEGKPCPPEFSSLPSTNWSWIDPSWQLSEEKWEYSNEIDGVYKKNEKEQGKARRRMWIRKARFELNKSPWSHVEAPPLLSVRVSKKEASDESITVIVLTKNGHILKRNGVNRENFSGDSWTEILMDSPVSSIHLQWEGMKLWCATSDNLIISKNIDGSSNWSHLNVDLSALYQSIAKNGLELTGYSNILYLRVGGVIYRYDTKNETISDGFPMENLQQAVVDAHGSICLRGTNITVVREWRVVPYADRKATIISMRNVERAVNMGLGIKNIAFY